MSKEIDEIRRKLREQFSNGNDTVFLGAVTEVDENEYTCTVRRDDAVDYFDVRLRGLVNADLQGLALIPKLESTVLVCRIGNSNELFVCQFTEIDKIVFDTDKVAVFIDKDKVEVVNDTSTIKVTANGLTLGRGDSGLKKTLNDLLTAITQLTVSTAVGPSSVPINMAEFEKIKQDLTNYMEG